MKIRPTKTFMFSLETVAVTDIILNMFIFFFISFSLLYTFNPNRAKYIKVNLPKAKHVAEPQAQDEPVRITLSREGPIYLRGSVVTLRELQDKLAPLVDRNPSLEVIVEIDRTVAFKNVVEILDVLNGLDITRLRIAAEEAEK